MQLISCYLYSNKIDVFTNASAAWKSERYRRVYNRNIKIYRGVNNRIDIQVRNSDEKAADTTGSTLVFNLVERETQKLVAKKDCVIVDASKGKYYVVLNESEMIDIESGYYQYSVYNEIRTDNGDNTHLVTSRTPLYIDSQYDVLATLEIHSSGEGDVQPSSQVRAFSLHQSYGEPFENYFVSGIIDAHPQISTPQSQHTFQFYFTNYTGTVEVQGSLSDGGNPEIWTTLATLNYQDKNLDYVNLTGKYNFFRVKHTPSRVTAIATFTIAQTIFGTYEVNIGTGGAGYKVGDDILIKGSRLGGEDTTNDLLITVTGIVSNIGRITNVSWTGTSYNGVKTFVLSGETPNQGTFDKILYR